MKRSEVVQQIRSLKHTAHSANPDPAWVASTRNRVLHHIERTTEEVPSRILTLNHVWSALSLIMPQKTVYAVVRPAVIFTVCFTLGTAGWITTVTASLESLPGDALYPVKLATEQTQVAVTEVIKGETASAELRVSFVSRRADEVTKVLSAPSVPEEQKQEIVNKAVANLQTEVESVSIKLSAVKNADLQTAVQIADAIDTKVSVIQQALETSPHTSSTPAVFAIAQLKVELDRVRTDAIASSTTEPATTSTTPDIIIATGSVTTTPSIVSSTTTSVVVSSTPVVIDIEPEKDPLADFPERPPELGPDVVSGAVPIQLKTWE